MTSELMILILQSPKFILRLLLEREALRYYMGHMSTDKTLQLSSASFEETEKLGEAIGRQLKGGEVIELTSDLGGGKTTFVRGLARGMGSSDKVASPTFTVSKQYTAGDLRLVHYDFYRLHDPGLLQYELAEFIDESKIITVVEWADIVHDVLPANRFTLSIKSTGDTSRQITAHVPTSLAYLLSEVS